MVVFDDGSHFIANLKMADQFLKSEHHSEASTRWIAIALHDALYALLIEKRTRTDGFGAFNDKFEKRVGEFYAAGKDSRSSDWEALTADMFKENIGDIGQLLRRAKLASGAIIQKKGTSSLDEPSRGLSRLKLLRDGLAHPRPGLSGYYADYLVSAFSSTITVIDETRRLRDYGAPRHDGREADLLLDSIRFYLSRWSAKSSARQT